MSTIKIYGIPNCDTIKKTMDWFKKHKKAVELHDYKKDGISKEKLTAWSKQVGWEILLNKRSTTWKALTPAEQAAVTGAATAIELMQQQTSIIKRPVIEFEKKLLVGFDENILNNTFK